MLPDIDSALMAAFESLALGIPTGAPNMDFTPPTDAMWAGVINVIGQSVVATLGDQGDDAVSGYFQVTLSVPKSSGTAALNAKREAVRQYFRLGRSFTYNNQPVRITYAKLSPVVPNGIYATGVIQLFWSANIRRSI